MVVLFRIFLEVTSRRFAGKLEMGGGADQMRSVREESGIFVLSDVHES